MHKIRPPFFEIGPKSYLYGDDVFNLAIVADQVAQKYDVDIIFTCPYTEIRRVAVSVERVLVFAPHMDPLRPGRGLADILPEAIKSAGAKGVMLNHCEKPLSFNTLRQTLDRAKDLDLMTMVCADTIEEAVNIAKLNPTIILSEPTALVGTGVTSSLDNIKRTIYTIKAVNPEVLILHGAGIRNGDDVYTIIRSGADATGSSSGIIKAKCPAKMIDEMISAVRKGWDDRINKSKTS